MLNADLRPTVAAQPATAGSDLLSLGGRRLDWLAARQKVLAANIANVDTPGYASKDIAPFQAALGAFDIAPVRTDEAHFGVGSDPSAEVTRRTGEKSLDGNAVSLDQELENVADVSDQQHLAVNLYAKYMSMFQTVLGK